MTLHNLRQDVRQEVRFRFHGLPRPEVVIADLYEVVDDHMPILAHDLLSLAQEDQDLAFTRPATMEIGGDVCPLNLLAVNLFDKLVCEAEDERRSLLEEFEG